MIRDKIREMIWRFFMWKGAGKNPWDMSKNEFLAYLSLYHIIDIAPDPDEADALLKHHGLWQKMSQLDESIIEDKQD